MPLLRRYAPARPASVCRGRRLHLGEIRSAGAGRSGGGEHPSRRLRSQPRRRSRGAVVALVAVVALMSGACQAKVAVDTTVEGDGTGTVTVSLGLDDEALARLGDPDATVEVADLRAAGWEIPPAERGADGYTWLRATKRFTDADGAARVMAELQPTVFRDFRLNRETGLGRTIWTWTGTVDVSPGIAVLGDPEAAAALGGDPFGGRVAEVEQAEGKPVAQMVDVTVSAQLPNGERQTWTPRLGDPVPTSVVATSSQSFALPVPAGEGIGTVLVLVAGVVLAVVAAVMLRRRFRRPT